MKDKDSVMKTLESYNDVFADIVNVLLFDGKRVVRKNALSDTMPYSYYKTRRRKAGKAASRNQSAGTNPKSNDEKAKPEIHGQERDVSKFWKHGRIRLCLIGFENQTTVEPLMPFRVMSYDAAGYMQQFLDKERVQCYPVITLVLYFGTKRRWKKNLSLKDVVSVPPELEPFVNDYRINVAELAWLTDEQINAFRSDFREIAVYLRCVRTEKPFHGSRRKLKHAFEVIDMLRAMSGNEGAFRTIVPELKKMIENDKGGDVNMCDPIQMALDESFSKGLRSGRKEGRSEGRMQGVAIATDNITSLFATLYSQGRDADVKKATSDRAYLNKLMAEYKG